MVTGEATYTRVAEAAESALDGYLLKPHKANQLAERLRQARMRKTSLQEIFAAIEWEEFERAANLCLERYETKGLFWLYAARVGAELMMRIGKYDQAQKLYEAIVAAKTLPWAKLGVARAMMESGQINHAVSALDTLISDDPSFADAYDVMGRAQFELGNLDQALATYKMACELTPNSVSRLQSLASMSFYTGDVKEAEKMLDRVALIGLDSKMFDPQTLVLLAFARLESKDRKGLDRCRVDLRRLMERNPDSLRLMRNAQVIEILIDLLAGQTAKASERVRQLNDAAKQPDFDFEACSNLVTL
jgi:predicted Zn-dependent protease